VLQDGTGVTACTNQLRRGSAVIHKKRFEINAVNANRPVGTRLDVQHCPQGKFIRFFSKQETS